jgi:uncharacterized repeat protein (TIGR01451 family)
VQNTNDAGPGSLRQAIIDANPNDEVFVPAGTYQLTGASLSIGKNLTVRGAGAQATVIDASGGANDRVFTLSDGDVTLRELAVTGGADTQGGGIRSTTNLTLDGVVVRGNTAGGDNVTGKGGGLFITGTAADLTLTDSAVSGNRAGGGGADGDGFGAGIYVDDIASGSARNVTIERSTLSGNVAGDDDGAGFGGAFFLDQITANSTFTLSVLDSTVSGNRAGGGGADGDGYGGAIFTETLGNSDQATLTLERTTLSGNRAGGGNGAGFGGAVFFEGSPPSSVKTLNVMNTTIAGNVAGGGGADGDGYGGGVHYSGTAGTHSMTLQHATVVGNVAGGTGGDGFGGGLEASGTTALRNSIVANNVGSSGSNCLSPVSSSTHNIESENTCGLPTANDNMIDTDPLLRPLGSYGGPTRTMPPLFGSPAIDEASPGFCLATDQRGVVRPQGAACDIGAAEVELANTGVTGRVSHNKRTVGRVVTYTYTVRNSGPRPAQGTRLTDVLPPKLARVAATAQGGTCAGARTIVCSLGTLGVNATRTVTIKLRPLRAGLIPNTARVSSFAADPTGGNNAFTHVLRAIPAASNLRVEPDTFKLGEKATIRFKLSDPAKVELAFARRVDGKFRSVGSRTVQGKRGPNGLAFRGKLDGDDLKPGRYRIRARARDALGNRQSPAAQTKFTLKPR